MLNASGSKIESERKFIEFLPSGTPIPVLSLA